MGTSPLLSALFVVVGICILAGSGYLLYEQHRLVGAAESVDATVVSSEVVVDEDGVHRPSVHYRYTYGGDRYESTNVYPGPGSPLVGVQAPETIVENYQSGEQVTAHVDPANPSRAFLIAEPTELPFAIGAIGGAVFVLLGGRSVRTAIAGP